MQNVKAEQLIHIEEIPGGKQITIPGDRPPVFPFIGLSIILLFTLLAGVDNHAWFIGTIALGALMFFAIRMHLRAQIIKMVDGKLIVKDKAYALDDIRLVEVGNAFVKDGAVVQGQVGGSVVVGSPMAVAGSVAADGLGRAAMGIANASIRSGAKKGFFVKIHYGTKEYMIAKALRENRARALFDVLTA
ncbi:hypothetical protein [Ralstonia pickettii]|jgi:hypothetical protein|uniref:hypothetical protein n=1 Tax=Ralstonia pickettii TaxID=329 RepID=UPI0015B98AAC|nr:hypothetical protein [Ralstonia pickettii]NWK43605.1 hypothetical protein [Ralstonia pickettii]